MYQISLTHYLILSSIIFTIADPTTQPSEKLFICATCLGLLIPKPTIINEIVKSEIKIIYVHARNAILNGISPKGNRTIPPLNYDFIRKIKRW